MVLWGYNLATNDFSVLDGSPIWIDGPTYLGGVDQFEEKSRDAHMIQSIVFRVGYNLE